MEGFKGKTGQLIALVGIVSTLAGFGYTGATYVNRLENLEKKVVGIAETKSGLQEIEERFEGIETSIKFINKTIDETIILEVRDGGKSITSIKVDVGSLKASIESMEVLLGATAEAIEASIGATAAALEASIENLEKQIDKLEEDFKRDNENPLLN